MRDNSFGDWYCHRSNERKRQSELGLHAEYDRVDERVIDNAVIQHDDELELRIASSGSIPRFGIATNVNASATEVGQPS